MSRRRSGRAVKRPRFHDDDAMPGVDAVDAWTSLMRQSEGHVRPWLVLLQFEAGACTSSIAYLLFLTCYILACCFAAKTSCAPLEADAAELAAGAACFLLGPAGLRERPGSLHAAIVCCPALFKILFFVSAAAG